MRTSPSLATPREFVPGGVKGMDAEHAEVSVSETVDLTLSPHRKGPRSFSALTSPELVKTRKVEPVQTCRQRCPHMSFHPAT